MLTLDEKKTASEYVNVFSIASQKLEDKMEGDTPESKLARFLEHITDDDYDVVKHQLTGDPTTSFDTVVSQIQTREQELKDSVGSKKKRARRFIRKGEQELITGKNAPRKNKIPIIPDFILWRVKPDSVRKDLIC